MGMINVVLADHERVFRTGMASVIAAEDDLRIVGQPSTPAQVTRAVETFRPHVLVMSCAFLGCIDAIRRACEAQHTAILLLQDYGDNLSHELSHDFHAVVGRAADEATLVKHIRQLARGGRIVRSTSSCVPARVDEPLEEGLRHRLTPSELKIVTSVVQGYKNREIAMRMGTSEHGIKRALRRIFDKTGVYGRLELALHVIHHRTLVMEAAGIQPPKHPMSVPSLDGNWYLGRRPTIQ